jgi:predicted NUDIX family phosphoesterase
MKNKEQILVVPVNHVSHIKNGLSGTILSLTTKGSFGLFDSIGIYEPRNKIDNNICLVKVAVVMLFKNEEGKYLVKELTDKTKRPCIELGITSLIKKESGNYNALLNQMNIISNRIGIDQQSYTYIGHIRDLANESTKTVLGTIYSVNCDSSKIKIADSKACVYRWYDLDTLVNNYSKTTNWSKELIDALLIKKITI